LGPFVDQPINVYKETFLPHILQETIRKASVVHDGQERPLIAREYRLLEAKRSALLSSPPSRTVYYMLVGILLGAFFTALGFASTKTKIARIAFGIFLSVLALISGFLGNLLACLWFFTDHVSAYKNENMLIYTPWSFALVVLGIGLAAGHKKLTRYAFFISAASFVSSVLALLFKVLPWFTQQNGRTIAFGIFYWAGISLGIHVLYKRLPERKTESKTA
jgi:hypothetical protein